MTAPPGLACREFVDLVTAYLDDSLPDDRRSQIDDHLSTCDGCGTVLGQWRAVIALAGGLTGEDIERVDEHTRVRLVNAFHGPRRR